MLATCNSCLEGILGRHRRVVLVPETSPTARRFPLSSVPASRRRDEENIVHLLGHRCSATYSVEQASTGATQLWASPVPRAATERSCRRDNAASRDEPPLHSSFEVEQFLQSPGSLPKPLLPHQREETIRRLLPTATHELLAQLPVEILQAEGDEAQNLRRRLAHGATVVFFTAGYSGKRFVFERALQLGIKSVIIEHPDSWSRGLLDEGIISKFIPIDMNRSAREIFEESVEVIKALGGDGVTGEADAVCSVVELSMPLVARICEELGLPGASAESVDTARDKRKTREVLKKAGLPTPRNFPIHSERDIDAAAAHVGFPAVLKPVSGAASLAVVKVTRVEDLVNSYRQVVAELQSLVVVSGALEQRTDSSLGVSADKVLEMTVLLEQYLDGDEVDVDLVFSNGQWRYACVSDNGPTLEPYFNETWGLCPSLLPLMKQRELKDLAVKSVEALGFWSGVFHVELKYTSHGPHLIEVNARMGGGPIWEMNHRVWGVDLVEETLFCALGIPAKPQVSKKPLTHLGYYLVQSRVSGIVKSLPRFDLLREQEDVIWAKPFVKVGDRIVGPDEGFPSWVCDIAVMKPSSEEARDYVIKWEAENRVQV